MSSKEEVSWYQNLPTIQQNLLEKLFAIEISKINVKMNKSVYLGLPILDIARELCTRIGMTMWNENYEKKAELCYTMGNQKIYMHVLLEILRKRFDTSNYEVKWPLPLEKQKKKKKEKNDWADYRCIGLKNNEIKDPKRLKMCSYLTDNECVDKKA